MLNSQVFHAETPTGSTSKICDYAAGVCQVSSYIQVCRVVGKFVFKTMVRSVCFSSYALFALAALQESVRSVRVSEDFKTPTSGGFFVKVGTFNTLAQMKCDKNPASFPLIPDNYERLKSGSDYLGSMFEFQRWKPFVITVIAIGVQHL